VEFEIMVKEILRRFRQTQIICLGFSMGANIVTRFLATPFMDLTDNKPAATAPDATSPAQAPTPAPQLDEDLQNSLKNEIDELAGGDFASPVKSREDEQEEKEKRSEVESSGVDVATSKDQPVKISSVPEHPEEVDSARVIAGISVCQGYDAVT
jgi:hypothetical protein